LEPSSRPAPASSLSPVSLPPLPPAPRPPPWLQERPAWKSPILEAEINGTVPITGTVDVPNFGFYKFEMRPQGGSDTSWLTILAGNEARQDANLGSWNTSLLPPGNYELGLVVTDNQGKSLPACVVNVRIAPPVQTPQS
jgi:hypothetical protein